MNQLHFVPLTIPLSHGATRLSVSPSRQHFKQSRQKAGKCSRHSHVLELNKYELAHISDLECLDRSLLTYRKKSQSPSALYGSCQPFQLRLLYSFLEELIFLHTFSQTYSFPRSCSFPTSLPCQTPTHPLKTHSIKNFFREAFSDFGNHQQRQLFLLLPQYLLYTSYHITCFLVVSKDAHVVSIFPKLPVHKNV